MSDPTDEVEATDPGAAAPPAAPAPAPTPTGDPMDKWKDRAIIALVSAIIGVFSGGSAGTVMGQDSGDDAKIEIIEAKCNALESALTAHQASDAQTLRAIEGKVGDIYRIVDQAHPRQ